MYPKNLTPEMCRDCRNDLTPASCVDGVTYLYRHTAGRPTLDVGRVVMIRRRHPENVVERELIELLDYLFYPELVDEFESSLVLRELRNEQV